MRVGHIIGVGLTLGVLIAFWMQRINDDYQLIWIPIVLTLVFVVSAIIWLTWDSEPSDDPKVVTRKSLIILTAEGMVFTSICTSGSLFFIMYQE